MEKTDWQEKQPEAPSVRDKPPELDKDGNPITDETVVDPVDAAKFKVIVRCRPLFGVVELTLKGTIDEQGLGLVSWWDQDEGEDEAMEE